MNNAAHQVRHDVRQLVVDKVQAYPEARAALATALSVPEHSIDRMLSRDVWDLTFALQTADALGMQLHVVGD